MSQFEFSVSPARIAIIAGCLAGAGLMVAAAGFTVGLILAPRFSPVMAEAVKQEEARLAAAKSAGVKKLEAVAVKVEAPKSVLEAPKPAEAKPPEAKPEEAKAEPPKPAEAKPETAPVAVVAAKPDATAAAAVKPAPKPPISLQVQVASFTSEANADSTVDRLKRSGYPASAVSRTDPNNREWHVVQVGPYYAYDDAAKTVLELSNAYRVSPVIISTRTTE
jgi:cell division protein FtsN